MDAAAKHRVRVTVGANGGVSVLTGLPVLDHLLTVLAEHGGFGLELELAPESADAEVAAAGTALGEAFADVFDGEVRGHGSAALPADEALAHVTLEASGRPLVVSNVDLSDARVGGLGSDLLSHFLHELAEGAGLTLHVRLLHGDDARHVLEAIFKALGVALAQASKRKET
jgi:imidazoleglycerol-phosphate dehydratase